MPRIRFGQGSRGEIGSLAREFGTRALLVTGAGSLRAGPNWRRLGRSLEAAGVAWRTASVDGEPTVEDIDRLVSKHAQARIDVVIGVGGGSVIDAAKAVAALLPSGDPVLAYLEGVGDGRLYQGPALPIIAAPTTAGTGSEATRNAVIGNKDGQGFKKSFRHESLVPQYAVVDPDLLVGCPRPQLAANAMDALTQLIESYTSTRASPPSRALAASGLFAIQAPLAAGLPPDPGAPDRSRLAYAALVSGICLAQTGLGAVHGLAAPLGAHFPIPHGVACGAVLAAATRTNLAALADRDPRGKALRYYAAVSRMLAGNGPAAEGDPRETLLARLEHWTRALEIPGLSRYGIRPADFDTICAGARGNSMKTNPVELSDDELEAILRQSL